MDSNTGSIVQSTSFGTTSTSGVGVTATATATITAIPSVSSVSPVRLGATTPAGPASTSTYASSASATSTTVTSLVVTGTAAAITMPNLPTSNSCLQQQQQQQQQQVHQQTQSLMIDNMKPEDFNNVSLVSAVSEGQRSHSGAPSASSSPILSPPGKIFGRNANGTMITTSRPSNEAEIQLYRVLQRASLLSYYDTLLEMGGDDVQQLYEAGEEEFLEIMALVGMASKPLHVRRLQKALHEWANNPAFFQGPVLSTSTGMCETPTKPVFAFNPETSPAVFARIKKFSTFSPTPAFNPTPLINTAAQIQSSSASAVQLLTQASCSPAVTVPVIQQQSPMVAASMPLPNAAAAAATAAALAASALASHQPSGSQIAAHQVSSSSPQLTPVLTELQVTRITFGAEKIANQLPQREPRAQTSKKRTSRELEQVIAMNENDPRRMEEIRKYSAIYGRFDCKRRPEKPLTLHEVCVNEAAAQLCRLVPALLTRRDELFPLARQIVKDAGFGHSASIARYGGLLPQMSVQTSSTAAASSSSSSSITALGGIQRSSVLVDCESSDSSMSLKRQRLSSTDTKPTLELNREFNEDSRYNLFAMYQKFAKPPFDLSDIAKFSLGKTDFDDNDNDNENDNDNDNDSRFSFSNSSNSPSSMPHNGNGENEREIIENAKFALSAGNISRGLENVEMDSGTTDAVISAPCNRSERQINLFMTENAFPSSSSNQQIRTNENSPPTTSFGGVQVISAAAAGHIIAVANPALVMSPALHEPAAMSLKREADTPDD